MDELQRGAFRFHVREIVALVVAGQGDFEGVPDPAPIIEVAGEGPADIGCLVQNRFLVLRRIDPAFKRFFHEPTESEERPCSKHALYLRYEGRNFTALSG